MSAVYGMLVIGFGLILLGLAFGSGGARDAAVLRWLWCSAGTSCLVVAAIIGAIITRVS